jgi:predicted component of type VI protein secretion system
MFSDIDDLFGLNPVTKDVIADIDDQAIRTSMVGLILTNKGENSNSSTRFDIARDIDETIGNFEPRVDVIRVEVSDEDIDNNKFKVDIFYKIVTDTETERLISFSI